jgi:hypothetical protein
MGVCLDGKFVRTGDGYQRRIVSLVAGRHFVSALEGDCFARDQYRYDGGRRDQVG